MKFLLQGWLISTIILFWAFWSWNSLNSMWYNHVWATRLAIRWMLLTCYQALSWLLNTYMEGTANNQTHVIYIRIKWGVKHPILLIHCYPSLTWEYCNNLQPHVWHKVAANSLVHFPYLHLHYQTYSSWLGHPSSLYQIRQCKT